MTRLILIRHGQTDWNLEGRYQGQSDPPLNQAGREQAAAMARRLAGQPIEAVYASDLQRAAETARIIADALGLEVHLRRGLREINQGAWEGMLFADIQARYGALWAARRRDPTHARPPGGESVAELAERVGAVLDEIARSHPAGPVVVVSHGLALATVLCRLEGLPLTRAYDLIPDNAHPLEVDWP